MYPAAAVHACHVLAAAGLRAHPLAGVAAILIAASDPGPTVEFEHSTASATLHRHHALVEHVFDKSGNGGVSCTPSRSASIRLKVHLRLQVVRAERISADRKVAHMATGKKAASDAGKVLSDPKSTSAEKSAAASDLAQVKRKGGN
jgi:hypothetical protein